MANSNSIKLNNSYVPSGRGLIIDSLQLSGPEQMAADVAMLEQAQAIKDFAVSIRFYTWEGVWLSIGHNQKNIPEKWIQLLKEKKLNIVRRPSGGNAVLHSGGLTYSLVWKSAPRKKLQAYYLVNQWLINCFSALNHPLQFGQNHANIIASNCFGLATPADLVDSRGNKRIGSAQFWRHGNLLQHGHILLDPPQELWVKLFSKKPPATAPPHINRESIEKSLLNSLKNHWSGIFWEPSKISPKDLMRINKNSNQYLFSLDRDIKPDEIIPFTNLNSDIPKG